MIEMEFFMCELTIDVKENGVFVLRYLGNFCSLPSDGFFHSPQLFK